VLTAVLLHSVQAHAMSELVHHVQACGATASGKRQEIGAVKCKRECMQRVMRACAAI
jgi:hypothetical protein